MWHFYGGGSLNVYVLNLDGKLEIIRIGSDPEKGDKFQAVVKAGNWFASKPIDDNSFSLVGCTVAPGFDFEDFELASRKELLSQYPQHKDIIEKLTRH